MVDTKALYDYLIWSDNLRGKDVDVSPEAYALEVATAAVMRECYELLISISDQPDFVWQPFQKALDVYQNAKENL